MSGRVLSGGGGGGSGGDSGPHAAPTTPYSRKIKQLVDSTRGNDTDLSHALGVFSDHFDFAGLGSAAAAGGEGASGGVHRKLRSVVDTASLNTHKEFLESLRGVNKVVNHTGNTVKQLEGACKRVMDKLERVRAHTQPLVDKRALLQRQELELQTKSAILQAFHKRFLLSESEVEVLSGDAPSPAFFQALQRAQAVHADCDQMVRNPQGNHQLGLQLLEQTTQHQDRAFETLYQYVQDECRTMQDDVGDNNPLLAQALHALALRPVLYEHCIEEIGAVRAHVVHRRFHTALTVGGPGGVPRPIELSAHDPVRYCSDMLAWTHQTIASEKLMLSALLVGPAHAASPRPDPSAMVNGVMGKAFSALAASLKERIGQVVRPDLNVVLSYKLCNLLQFYTHTVCDMVDADSPVAVAVRECADKAIEVFEAQVKSEQGRIAAQSAKPTPELTTPKFVFETTSKLKDIVQTHKTAMVHPDEQRCTPLASIAQQLSLACVDACDKGASEEQDQRRLVFLLNVVSTIQHALEPIAKEGLATTLQTLRQRSTALSASLVDMQVSHVLRECGLQAFVDELDKAVGGEGGGGTRLAQADGCSPEAVASMVQRLNASVLAYGPMLALPHCDRLTNAVSLMAVRKNVAKEVARQYGRVYAQAMLPAGGYDNPARLFPHKPEQVCQLLDVDQGGDEQ